jgi:HD-like signal output (HDOD) protein
MHAMQLEVVGDSDTSADKVLSQIEDAIKKDEIKLPAMPDIAMKIRDAFKDEQYDILKIANIVQTEAGLAAYILKVANSPLHRGPIPIKTAKHAVCRLGQHSVQSMVLTYTLRAMFQTSSAQLKSLLQKQWEQSTCLAAISALLADRCDDFDPDQALLGGLLQDIGCLPLLDWLANNHNDGENLEAAYKDLTDKYASRIGEIMLRSWQFDEELVEVVKSRGDWNRSSGADADVDIADIVTIARHHQHMGRGELKSCPTITSIPAYHKLPFKELTPDQSLHILEEAKEEIEEIRQMLM